MMSITCHFSGGEEPWQLRESSVGGGIRARALAEFIVRCHITMQNEILKILSDIEFGNEFDAFEGAKRLSNYKLSKGQVEALSMITKSGKVLHNKEAATYALAFIENSDEAIITLIDLLSSSENHELVRGQAAEGLGIMALSNLKFKKAVENILLKSLKDPSPMVRFWSCYAVGQLGLKKAVFILEEIKANDREICPNWWYVSEEAEDAIEWINGRDGKDRIPVNQRKTTEPAASQGPQGPRGL